MLQHLLQIRNIDIIINVLFHRLEFCLWFRIHIQTCHVRHENVSHSFITVLFNGDDQHWLTTNWLFMRIIFCALNDVRFCFSFGPNQARKLIVTFFLIRTGCSLIQMIDSFTSKALKLWYLVMLWTNIFGCAPVSHNTRNTPINSLSMNTLTQGLSELGYGARVHFFFAPP